MRSGRERVRRSWEQARRSLGGLRTRRSRWTLSSRQQALPRERFTTFKGIGELAAAVGAGLSQSFDELLTPARLDRRDPIERLSFAFMKFLERANADTDWARLVIQSSQSPIEFGLGVRANLKADIGQAIAQGRVSVRDVELAADIAIGIWLEVTRGIIERGPRPGTTSQALDATLRALGLGQR